LKLTKNKIYGILYARFICFNSFTTIMIFFQLIGLLLFLVVLYILYPSDAQDEQKGGDVTDEKDYDRVLRNENRSVPGKKKWRSRIPYARLIREVVYFIGPVLSEKESKNIRR